MTKLYPVIILSLLFSYLAQSKMFKREGIGTERNYNRLFFICTAVTLILFAGLRTAYNDTGGYTYVYRHTVIDETAFDSISWAIGDNPGFYVANIFLKRLGVSDQTFLLIYSAITLSIYVWFIFKYSTNPALSVFLLISMGAYTFTMAAIKQCVAIALCLLATHFVMKKKWILFVVLVLLASTFHVYALMFLIVPFLNFRPWSTRTVILLAIFAGAGFMLESLLDTVVNVTTMFGEEYDVTVLSGSGVNPLRLAVVAVPVLLSLLLKKYIRNEENKSQNLILNLSTLNAEIMFVALFGTANYFARLANYFLVFQTISLPWLLHFFEKKSRALITIIAVISYAAYMYYGHAINEVFDADYSGITLIYYLKSIFVS